MTNPNLQWQWSLPADWPQPDADALSRSQQLCAQIAASMRDGWCSFEQFMQQALYVPGLGYYSAANAKFGAEGDFVTAPEISPLFSGCVARQVAQVLQALPDGEVLEFGAGSGVMAAEMLLELERMDSLPKRYTILELSGELRARQRDTISARAPHLIEYVEWLDQLPSERFNGVVVANEVLDALPVALLHRTGEQTLERGVALAEDGQWLWQDREPSSVVNAYLARLAEDGVVLRDGYITEAHVGIAPWVATLSGLLNSGLLLLIDYGYTRSDYYRAERSAGTMMCHYRHRAHPEPLTLVGLQDITAYVDFTTVAEAAVAADMRVDGFTTQAQFLLGCGITELATRAPMGDMRAQLELAQQIKQLTLPGEMGERFKVIALTRDLDLPLIGFAHDLRGRL
jgi:SAM-dependent MidA family methyltransferase